jgi:hypothetical protein
MDWHKGAASPNYPAAVANAELVGRQEANLIAMMIDVAGMDPGNLHLTGYSLGGQLIPNFVANFLRVLKPDVRIPRITGRSTKSQSDSETERSHYRSQTASPTY